MLFCVWLTQQGVLKDELAQTVTQFQRDMAKLPPVVSAPPSATRRASVLTGAGAVMSQAVKEAFLSVAQRNQIAQERSNSAAANSMGLNASAVVRRCCMCGFYRRQRVM